MIGPIPLLLWRLKWPIIVALIVGYGVWRWYDMTSTIATQELALERVKVRAVQLNEAWAREVEAREFSERAHNIYRRAVANSQERSSSDLAAIAEASGPETVLDARLPPDLFERLRNDRGPPAGADDAAEAAGVDD